MCHNHLSNNDQIGNKKSLYQNMTNYYKLKELEVSSYLPTTFVVKSTADNNFKEFLNYAA